MIQGCTVSIRITLSLEARELLLCHATQVKFSLLKIQNRL